MSDTPDLGKIVSLIMENPDLISKIQGLVKGGDAQEASAPVQEKNEVKVPEEKVAEAATVIRPQFENRDKRKALLSAMKPYLSTERSKAIDSMMSVAEILDLMKSR